MRIGLLVNTPAQVHFWKFIVRELSKRGHEIMILFRDRGETLELAKEVGMEGQVYAIARGGGFSKAFSFPLDVLRAAMILREFKPDLVLDFGIYGVAVARLLRARSLVFTDSEPSIMRLYEIQYRLLMPFVDKVVTPSFFRDDLGPKQVRVDSLKELAYLHPDYFIPDRSVLDLVGARVGERYVVIRFNDLAGVHDIGLSGFSLARKVELVRSLEEAELRVFVSFEGKVPVELEKYRLSIPKSRIHDLLYYADLLVTDTQTMATEAAILGTPVIRCNSFVGTKDMGNFKVLENFELLYAI